MASRSISVLFARLLVFGWYRRGAVAHLLLCASLSAASRAARLQLRGGDCVRVTGAAGRPSKRRVDQRRPTTNLKQQARCWPRGARAVPACPARRAGRIVIFACENARAQNVAAARIFKIVLAGSSSGLAYISIGASSQA